MKKVCVAMWPGSKQDKYSKSSCKSPVYDLMARNKVLKRKEDRQSTHLRPPDRTKWSMTIRNS